MKTMKIFSIAGDAVMFIPVQTSRWQCLVLCYNACFQMTTQVLLWHRRQSPSCEHGTRRASSK